MPFQFLIGRLDTHTWHMSAPGWLQGFQFLIGRLDTQVEVRELEVLDVFQFLIGRLDTRDGYGMKCSASFGFNSS